MSNAISLKRVSKSYDGTKAVDDLSLTVERGEFFGFLGPNGAGKTTTIRMLTGMFPPDTGEILIENMGADRKSDIARAIGVMPESRGLYGWMTPVEYLTFFAHLYGIPKQQQAASIEALLKQVGLLQNKNESIGTFSRGMKQRIALARSLINRPRILFLDEPTLGLDPQGQEDIQILLRKLHSEGVTIFLSSHLLPEVSRLCTRIGIIHKGKLVVEGTMDELQKKTQLRESSFLRIRGSLRTMEKAIDEKKMRNINESNGETNFLFDGSSDEINELIDYLRKNDNRILELRPAAADLTDIFLTITRS